MQNLKHLGLAVTMILALCGSAPAQTTAYHVTVQAPALPAAKPSGTLIFEFDGGAGALPATASISSLIFSNDYTLDGYTAFDTATAPATPQSTTATISSDPANASGFYTDAAPFGTQMSFDVTFSGAALKPTAPYPGAGSDFLLVLLDSSGDPIWTLDPQGRVLDIPINADGTFGAAPYSLSSVATVVPTPEPSSGVALGSGIVLLFGLVARARRHGRPSEASS